MCLLNLLAWKASWAHRTGENEKKKDNDKIKKVDPNVERLWSALYTLHTHTLRVYALSVCVCVCVCACMCVCVAKPVAVELRCHATALISYKM